MEPTEILTRAKEFLTITYQELELKDLLIARWENVKEEILRTGTWIHTSEELTHGARMAWRNSNRCIGRLFWKSLKVIDARHVKNADMAFNYLIEHLNYGFNNGDIRPVITVFPQKMPGDKHGPRIWNNQLISFAGHATQDGGIIGDPLRVQETKWFANRGYLFPGTAFDVLPVALQWPGQDICIQELTLPEKMIVPLEHPEFPWFANMHLRWYALPVISDMSLDIGGVKYSAAPFNGWYMGTEIGSRNLCDEDRYNILQSVAKAMGLDTTSNWSLWKDSTLVEVNKAVLFSFQKNAIKISNHHDSASQFLHFEHIEYRKGRKVNADWSWIVPPMSGSSTPVFHKVFENEFLDPNFHYQPSLFKDPGQTMAGCPFHGVSKF